MKEESILLRMGNTNRQKKDLLHIRWKNWKAKIIPTLKSKTSTEPATYTRAGLRQQTSKEQDFVNYLGQNGPETANSESGTDPDQGHLWR